MFFFLLALLRANALVITSGSTVVIEHAVHEDIYISAGTVLIQAPVYGSLIVAGGTVTVKDSILNDILIVGGELNFHGYVGGTIRCAGGRLKIASNIRHDLVAGGGALTLEKQDTVGGDLLATAGNLIIDGVVNGNSRIKAWHFWRSSFCNTCFPHLSGRPVTPPLRTRDAPFWRVCSIS